jgi:hypothetical protein
MIFPCLYTLIILKLIVCVGLICARPIYLLCNALFLFLLFVFRRGCRVVARTPLSLLHARGLTRPPKLIPYARSIFITIRHYLYLPWLILGAFIILNYIGE